MTLSRYAVAVVGALIVACKDGTGPTRSCTGPALLYAYKGESQGTEIVAMNGDGTERTVLVPQGAGQELAAAAWSPDGCRIAFAMGLDRAIYLVSADGRGLRQVSEKAAWVARPSWRR